MLYSFGILLMQTFLDNYVNGKHSVFKILNFKLKFRTCSSFWKTLPNFVLVNINNVSPSIVSTDFQAINQKKHVSNPAARK